MLKKLVPAILVGCTAVASAAQYDYDWVRARDSPGHDLKQVQDIPSRMEDGIPFLKAACDADDRCLGFNTNGWLKYAISAMKNVPSEDWQKSDWTYGNGLWTKKVADGHSKSCYDDVCTWVTTPLPSETSPTEGKCVQDGERCSTAAASQLVVPSSPTHPCCGGGQAPSTCTEKDLSPQAGGSGWLCWPSIHDRYDFFHYHDSPQENIRKIEYGSLESIASACDWDKECMGFNTNGWLKRTILQPPRDVSMDWPPVQYEAMNDYYLEGLYTKKKSKGSGWLQCGYGPDGLESNDTYCSWSTWFPSQSTSE